MTADALVPPSDTPRRVCVIGAGSWGTALAVVLARNGHDTTLWGRDPALVRAIRTEHHNPGYLPGLRLPAALGATADLTEAVTSADVIVSAVPAQHVAEVLARAAPHLRPDMDVVSASKGIEINTLRRMDQVIHEIVAVDRAIRFAVLSGPSFAQEVVEEAPTAVVVASTEDATARRVQALFSSRSFRVYTSPDVIGVEIGGALKNVVALAAGVATGLGFGHNTRAALITRGLAEITRLGVELGARRETFSGLAGMGDLVLTCTGDLSRNRTVGVRLGRGESLESILDDMHAVAEGVKTTEAVVELARRHGVEMPIATEVQAILAHGRSPAEALDSLMSRDPKPEEWS